MPTYALTSASSQSLGLRLGVPVVQRRDEGRHGLLGIDPSSVSRSRSRRKWAYSVAARSLSAARSVSEGASSAASSAIRRNAVSSA